MPTLLIHHAGQRRGVVLSGRLLVGRVAPAGIVLADPEISRIHAWIDRVGDRFYIADAGSRSGTIVDEFPIAGRHTLLDRDEIRIGSAVLTYCDQEHLPDDVTPQAISHSNGEPIPASGGILFACRCGAPLWAPLDWVGRRGKCAQCGERTPVPALAAARPAVQSAIKTPSAPAPPKVAARAPVRQCSICQWAIEPTDAQHACPTCGLTFHAECWEANKGCSAYGCASVEALAEPADEEAPINSEAPAEQLVEEHQERFPTEFAMLGGSVVCSLISLIAFGVPSALLAVGTSAYWITQRRRGESLRNGIVAAAMAMCITGICAGLWFSAFRWLHRPLAAPWQPVS
jgi:predicted RNA-binding Zn-ribbon protein involved in translation (DUF1610 family)